MSDIRHDRVHGTHVIIAPERLHRPNCYGDEEKEEVLREEHCPFCEGNESMTPPEIFTIRETGSLPNKKGWKTRVVPNLYKAVQIEAAYEHHYGFFDHWEGFGAHELIIDTPVHHTSITQWSESEVVNWLQTLRARVSDLRKDGRIAYISLFKNEGSEAGASQQHCHTQLIGLPIVPKLLKERYQRSLTYYKQNACALLESEIEQEEASKERVVAKHGDFTAYCPYASAYPFEVVISSKKAVGQIDTLHDETIAEVATLLRVILKNMKKQLGCFTFNLAISTPPLQAKDFEYDILTHTNEMCRFSIRIMPRLYHIAGFEVSTGIMINPVAPEHAAKLLRESANE
jgi:UDPglucose--hexose-1-phosphate uridylyltransferase